MVMVKCRYRNARASSGPAPQSSSVSPSCTGIAIKLALRIDGHRSTSNARAPQILACIAIQVIRFSVRINLAMSDKKVIVQLAQALIEFDSGVK